MHASGRLLELSPEQVGATVNLTIDVVALAAELYNEALGEGQPPTQHVADTLGCSRATAGRWVAKARGRGLIPATSPILRPQTKLFAVARRLGVDPNDLRRAIVVEANGRLTCSPGRCP